MTATNASLGHHEETSSFFMTFVFHKLVIGALLISYFLILSVLYEMYISPIFGYRGFTIDRNPYVFWVSIVTIACVSAVFRVSGKPSSMILYFYVLFMLIPQLSYTYNSNGHPYVATMSGIVFFILYLSSKLPMEMVRTREISFEKFEKLIYLFLIFVVAYSFYRLGHDQFSLRIDEVYKRREILEQRYDRVLSISIGLSFIMIVFLSIVKSAELSLKIFIPLATGLLLFGMTGHKKFALVPIACVVIYRMISLSPKYSFYIVTGSILAAALYYIFFGLEFVNVLENYKAMFFTMFFTRTLSIPAQLNDLYFDFFSNNGFLFWSYSKVGLGFFQYDFDWSPAQLVGFHMFTKGSANTGIIGSGYMNAGTAGVVIYAIIAGMTMAFVDRIAKLRGNRALYTMLALPSFLIIFTSSDLPNVYFSQGFGVILLMMWVFQIDVQPKAQSGGQPAKARVSG